MAKLSAWPLPRLDRHTTVSPSSGKRIMSLLKPQSPPAYRRVRRPA
ncbi:hypothetical protein HUA74_03730 [Myxococcus sp. CA051A]|nr:hypothetical protein [Myxococcus sp. CA051A]NTX59764.1 hypothetical protein [Myxococcus sp. CA051A]